MTSGSAQHTNRAVFDNSCGNQGCLLLSAHKDHATRAQLAGDFLKQFCDRVSVTSGSEAIELV
jgi:hypothetical protein